MWESILNYSVYTVSHCWNGQTITDGGPSATTQQAKEANKVKQSSEGHIRKHFWEGWLCPWEAINSLIISVSTTAAYQLSAPAICREKNIGRINESELPSPNVSAITTSLMRSNMMLNIHTAITGAALLDVLVIRFWINFYSLPDVRERILCRSTKWLCETQFHDWTADETPTWYGDLWSEAGKWKRSALVLEMLYVSLKILWMHSCEQFSTFNSRDCTQKTCRSTDPVFILTNPNSITLLYSLCLVLQTVHERSRRLWNTCRKWDYVWLSLYNPIRAKW